MNLKSKLIRILILKLMGWNYEDGLYDIIQEVNNSNSLEDKDYLKRFLDKVAYKNKNDLIIETLNKIKEKKLE